MKTIKLKDAYLRNTVQAYSGPPTGGHLKHFALGPTMLGGPKGQARGIQ